VSTDYGRPATVDTLRSIMRTGLAPRADAVHYFPARGALRGASGFDSRTLDSATGRTEPLSRGPTHRRENPCSLTTPQRSLSASPQAFSLTSTDVEREMADIDGIDAPADYDSAAFTFDPFVA
jgi:hypothetical protein